MFRLLPALSLLVLLCSASHAAPSLTLEHSAFGVARLLLSLDEAGGFETEVAVTATGGLRLSDIYLSDPMAFDREISGDSPFIPGSPTGGDATGLSVNADASYAFAAFGGPGPAAGDLPFLTIEFTGYAGTISANGFVVQSVLESPVVTDLTATLLLPYTLKDVNVDGVVNTLDINPFVLTLTDPAAYASAYPGVPVLEVADINFDGTVNTLDIDPFVAIIVGGAPLTSTTTAPEPSPYVWLAVAGLRSRRRRRPRLMC